MKPDDDDELTVEPTRLSARLPITDDAGNTLGYVDLQQIVSDIANRNNLLDHLKHEIQQVRNSMLRLQTQVRMLETKLSRR